MKGFVRVAGYLSFKREEIITPFLDGQPKRFYIALTDVMCITEITSSETKISDDARVRILECFTTCNDKQLHRTDCKYDGCLCFVSGFPDHFYPLIIIRTRADKEYLVYPDQQNRQLLMAPEVSQEAELLRQILQELQYGSPAGSEYNAARKRFYRDLEKE